MSKIAVIIPFFQRKTGLLAQSLGSIAGQRLADGTEVEIVVVDDQSPVDAADEVAAVTFPPGMTARVLRQANAGPAAARNTGLSAVSGDVDFVAFLDSDDVWFEDHLQTAIDALGTEGGLYFCDNYEDEPATTFGGTHYFSDPANEADYAPVPGCPDLYRFHEGKAFAALLQEYIMQTSTVVFRRACCPDERFDPALRFSGEDWFFWLVLAGSGFPVVFSKRVHGGRGHGVSIYRDAYSWASPKAIQRLLGDLLFWKAVKARWPLTQSQAAHVERQILTRKRGICYLSVRNAARHPLHNLKIMARFLRADPAGFALFPAHLANAFRDRAAGRASF